MTTSYSELLKMTTHTLETNIRRLDIARINGGVRGWRKRTGGDRRQRAGVL